MSGSILLQTTGLCCSFMGMCELEMPKLCLNEVLLTILKQNAYRTIEPQAIPMIEASFIEADALWQLEQISDSLPTVAAAQLLSLVSIYNGYDGGFPYLNQGIQMAQRMGLFGLPGLDATTFAAGQGANLEHWTRASSHTAWGVFNCIV